MGGATITMGRSLNIPSSSETHPMKRKLLTLSLALLCLSALACKSASRPGASGEKPAPGTSANAGAEIPPGAEEFSEEKLRAEARQNPEDPNARYNLGNAYLVQKKYGEA